MSNYREGCSLTLEEIAAILSLAGKDSLVGVQSDWAETLTGQKLVSACCALMRDKMMACIDGKFRMCHELVAVMENLCHASAVLVVTPSSNMFSQVVYYVAERVTSMEMKGKNRYVLRSMECNELPVDLAERMDVIFQEKAGNQQVEVIPVETWDEQQVLLYEARFVIEQLDPDTGARNAWARQNGDLIQWTAGGEIRSERLTESAWMRVVQFVSEGERRK